MLLPELFGENFLNDNFFDGFIAPWADLFRDPAPEDRRCHKGPHHPALRPGQRPWRMATDIREVEGGYELDVELPGYRKEDVKVELENGNLTISASREEKNDEKDEKGNYIRRERRCGSCRRAFYVGENLSTEDIKAKFEDGVLKLTVPKEQPKVEEKKLIAIEG